MSIPKTKLTVSGDGEIECVDEFPYLGSVVMINGRLDAAMDRSIAHRLMDNNQQQWEQLITSKSV